MTNRDVALLKILKIGLNTSTRGAGLSLRDALGRSNYKQLRASFNAEDLRPLIRKNRELIQEWIDYSADKRTDGGWYLTEQGEIGQAGTSGSLIHFSTLDEAVAYYVVRELDFWASMNVAGISMVGLNNLVLLICVASIPAMGITAAKKVGGPLGWALGATVGSMFGGCAYGLLAITAHFLNTHYDERAHPQYIKALVVIGAWIWLGVVLFGAGFLTMYLTEIGVKRVAG
jgi:hypothetical protein